MRGAFRVGAGIFLASSSIYWSGAHAQEAITLEKIVVDGDKGAESGTGPVKGYVAKRTETVSKTDIPLIETPQAVNIITAKQMEDQGVETLSDSVRYTPGVSLSDGAGDSRGQSIIIRGFESQQFLDGTLLAPTYGQSMVEPYGLERIEVLKGPASVLYGQASPGGMINMVSKRPTAEKRGEVILDGGLGAGDFQRLQGQLDVSGPLNEDGTLLYRFVGLARDADALVADQPNDRLYAAPSFTWKPTEDTTITWLNQYAKDNGGVYQQLPTQGTLLPNPNGKLPISLNAGQPGLDYFHSQFWSTGYVLDHNFTDDVTFSQTMRYGRYRDDYTGVYFSGLQPDMRMADRTALAYDSDISNFTIDNRLGTKFDTGALAHDVLVGLDFTKTDYSDAFGNVFSENNGGDVPSLDLFNPVYPAYAGNIDRFYRTTSYTRNTGLYAQDVVRYDNLTVMGGVRHDWAYDSTTGLFTTDGSKSVSEQRPEATTFRLGAVYRFDNGLAPYMSYSESFQPVSGGESFDQVFKPTTGKQYEVGLRYEIPDTDTMVTLSVFDLTQQNVLTPDPDNPFRSIQTGEIEVRGAELEAKASLDNGWNITGGLAYLDGKVTETSIPTQMGLEAARTPQWMASLWADYTFNENDALRGLTVGGGVRFVDSFYSFQPSEPGGLKVPAATLVDAHLEYDFGVIDADYKGLSLEVNATNLFNKTTYAAVDDSFVTIAPGREVSASLAYRW